MTWKKLLFGFGILGTLASIISLIYIFTPIKQKAKLEINILSSEKLTSFDKVDEPEFFVDYFYKEIEIENLWKINVKLKNNSGVTIIGAGNQKNIIYDTLFLYVANECKIIDSKELSTDLKHTLKIKDNKLIKLSFLQWRENEELNYSFYVQSKSDSIDLNSFIKEEEYRQIIDGDIYFNYSESKSKSKFTDFIPRTLRNLSYIYAIVAIGLVLILIIVILISAPIEHIKVSNWKSHHLDSYNNFLISKFEKDTDAFKEYKNPDDMPDYLWKESEVTSYPDIIFDFNFSSIKSLLTLEIVLTIFLFSLGIVWLDLIFYLP